jgi:RimJ/RimL family protein N-acetyltransferase
METTLVKLVPLKEGHASSLYFSVGANDNVFRNLLWDTPQSVLDYAMIVKQIKKNNYKSFAVIDKATKNIVGTTSYVDYSKQDKSVEIGGTFYAESVWKSHVNTHSKYLMLQYAFEVLGCERVMFKTDAMNEQSQKAILRLGATYEGTKRHNKLRPNGTWRDTSYFSILGDEWDDIKYTIFEGIELDSPYDLYNNIPIVPIEIHRPMWF